jgi:hypothetical protein
VFHVVVLIAEEPEPDVMNRPPRDPKAPLLDKTIAWRTFLLTVLFVVAMLGNLQWELDAGNTLAQGRAVAMSTLVIAQCLYALNCRYVYTSSLTYRVFMGNPWLLGMIVLNAAIQVQFLHAAALKLHIGTSTMDALQVFLVYTPGVQSVWGMQSIGGAQWGKILLLSFIIFFIVELDKFLEPRLAHRFQPMFQWMDRVWKSITCKCCLHPLCRTVVPTSAAAMTGLPSNRSLSIRSNASPTAVQPMEEVDRRDNAARIAKSFRGPGHLHNRPSDPDVARFVTESKRRLNLGSGPSSRSLTTGEAVETSAVVHVEHRHEPPTLASIQEVEPSETKIDIAPM